MDRRLAVVRRRVPVALATLALAGCGGGIDRVAFYRADVGADVLLGSVGRAPYQWDAQLPIDASGSLQFFAVATDLEGNQTRSAAVVVFVVP